MRTTSLNPHPETPKSSPSWLRIMACLGTLASLPSCAERTMGDERFKLGSLPLPGADCHPRVVEPCKILLEMNGEGEAEAVATIRGYIRHLDWIEQGDAEEVLDWTDVHVFREGEEAVLHEIPVDMEGDFYFQVPEGNYQMSMVVSPPSGTWVEGDLDEEGNISGSLYSFQVVEDLFEDSEGETD